MQSSPDTASVLENVRKDPCVPPSVVKAFFKELAKTAPWNSPDEAWGAAKQVVESSTERFNCTGNEVPQNIFRHLLRCITVRDMYRGIQDKDRQEAIRRKHGLPGVLDKEWPATMSDRQLKSLCMALQGPFQVGRPGGFTWAADRDEIPWENLSPRLLTQCLGLDAMADEVWFLLLLYNRRQDVSLHVPRAFDGIGQPAFEVTVDCSAETGRTRVLDGSAPGAEGYNEAVHRSAEYHMDTVRIRRLDGDSA